MAIQPENPLAKRSLYLLVARLFPALALLAVMIGASRTLPVADYGHYQNLWVRYGLLSTVACMGIPALVQLLRPAETAAWLRGKGRGKGVFIMLLSLSAALFAWWNGGYLPFLTALGFFAFSVFATLAEGLALGLRCYRMTAVVNTIAALLFVGLHVLLLSSPTTLFSALAALSLLRTGALLLPVWKEMSSSKSAGNPSPQSLKTAWRDMALYDLVQQSGRYLDKAIVGLLVSPALSAVYFNGAQEVPFLPLLLGAASSAFFHSAADVSEEPVEEKARLLRATGRLLSAFVFPLFWFLMLGKTEIFTLVFGPKYAASVSIFAMTTLMLPLRAYPFSAMLQHLRQGKWVLWGAVGDLLFASTLGLGLYYVLGLPGIALAFTVSTACMCAFYTWKTMSLTGLKLTQLFPLRDWAMKFFVSALVLGAGSFCLSFASFSSLTKLVIVAILAAVLTAFWGFRKPARQV